MMLRAACIHDAERLLRWRNDPVTCASFRSTAAVSHEDHARWMRMHVVQGYPVHSVLIGEEDRVPVGVVRFDMMDDVLNYETSITIAPDCRGMGLGSELLGLACEYLDEVTILHAQIRKENKASRRIFEANGFKLVGRSDGFVNYRRMP